MSVTLDPAQLLTFSRPLTVVVKRTLTIGNAGDEPVAFKVKTTAPKLYCVRPNAGRIQPGELVDVIVMLLPMKEDPPLSTKCKDKFLVQSTIIPPEKDHLPFQDVWNVGPEEPPLDVHQQKIKVAWLPPEGLPTTEEGDENEYANQSLMSHAGDESHYVTVRGVPPTNGINGINGSTVILPPPAEPHLDPRASTPPIRAFSPAYHDSADDHHEVPPIITVHTPPRTPPPVAPAAVEYSPPPAAVPIPAPSSHPEPAAELQEAFAEIARLRSLVDSMPTPAAVEAAPEQTLRQRKGFSREVDGHKEDSRDVSYEQSVDGFSPQQVLFIAAAVFVLTYLFF